MSGDSRILSLEAWKALALKGAAPQEAGVCKPFVLDEVKAVEGDERALRIRITTAAVDRDGDTISPTGWKLTNYRKNPVVLYGHDYRGLPIARNTKIEPDDRFSPTDNSGRRAPSANSNPFSRVTFDAHQSFQPPV